MRDITERPFLPPPGGPGGYDSGNQGCAEPTPICSLFLLECSTDLVHPCGSSDSPFHCGREERYEAPAVESDGDTIGLGRSSFFLFPASSLLLFVGFFCFFPFRLFRICLFLFLFFPFFHFCPLFPFPSGGKPGKLKRVRACNPYTPGNSHCRFYSLVKKDASSKLSGPLIDSLQVVWGRVGQEACRRSVSPPVRPFCLSGWNSNQKMKYIQDGNSERAGPCLES
ncbi:hypothetical protein BDW62DRAFT_174943 [Aspergillus aurantiobrunneus]